MMETITLANTITNASNTVLDGKGHQVIISRGNTVRVSFCHALTALGQKKATFCQERGSENAGDPECY